MARTALVRSRAFSLIELVIVVVIIGIIAAIAVPRLSRGAEGAADSSVAANLAVLRNAIEMFKTEHGGTLPTEADIVAQLTQFTDDAGAVSATRTTTHIYGPYLRVVPPLPVGTRKGSAGIAAADGVGIGWLYDEATGTITANTGTLRDARNVLYSSY
jgi:general secretion pathway protein G